MRGAVRDPRDGGSPRRGTVLHRLRPGPAIIRLRALRRSSRMARRIRSGESATRRCSRRSTWRRPRHATSGDDRIRMTLPGFRSAAAARARRSRRATTRLGRACRRRAPCSGRSSSRCSHPHAEGVAWRGKQGPGISHHAGYPECRTDEQRMPRSPPGRASPSTCCPDPSSRSRTADGGDAPRGVRRGGLDSSGGL